MEELEHFIGEYGDIVVFLSRIAVIIMAIIAIGGIIYKFFKKLIEPKIKIYFKEKETYHTRKIPNLGNVNGLFLHIMVKNAGFRKVKDCCGQLLKIEERKSENKEFIEEHDFDPVRLHWAHEDSLPKNIERKLPKKLDVCFAVENDKRLSIFTEQQEVGIKTKYMPGIYRFVIGITGENVRPKSKKFLIYWNGNWKDLKIAADSFFNRKKNFFYKSIESVDNDLKKERFKDIDITAVTTSTEVSYPTECKSQTPFTPKK